MGISKYRFAEDIVTSITNFFCGICKDVVRDPILTKECQHYLCRACVTADINICPTCRTIFKGYDELGVALQRIYSSIKLRCVYHSCNESLTIENYIEHEQRCPEGFYKCPHSCGFTIRLSLDEAQRSHNCVDILHSKIVALEAVNKDLQCVNVKLNIQNKVLKLENTRLSTANSEQKKRRVTCGVVLSKGEKFYRCFTCQIRRMSVLCLDCFENGEHENHRYSLMVVENDNGCFCDCGDTVTLHPETSCANHKI